MNASDLDRRIIIDTKGATQESVYGTEVVAWAPLDPLPGSPLTGSELYANVKDVKPSRSEAVKQGLNINRLQTVVTIRYRSDVDSSMRIRIVDYGLRTLQIVGGPAEIGRREFTEFMCESFSS